MTALRAAVAAAVLWIAAVVAPTQASACRLALVLALDVSSSVDASEYALQAEGLAAALEDPDVIEAILSPGGPVAIAVFEWSGEIHQTVVSEWRVLNSPDDVLTLARTVRSFSRSAAQFPTALGSALGFAAQMLAGAPPCGRRTVDVSGDGANNSGIEPFQTYASTDFADVTVNALVIGGTMRPALIRYFQTLVIRGPDAFTEVAADYRDYGRAMKRKLLREIAPPMVIGAVE